MKYLIWYLVALVLGQPFCPMRARRVGLGEALLPLNRISASQTSVGR